MIYQREESSGEINKEIVKNKLLFRIVYATMSNGRLREWSAIFCVYPRKSRLPAFEAVAVPHDKSIGIRKEDLL